MKRVLALVEGQTEETFLDGVIAPWLMDCGLAITPTLVTTKRIKGGNDFKGGLGSYARVRQQLIRLLGDSDIVALTTMFDYYGLPEDFPGMEDLPASGASKRVEHLEASLRNDLSDPRFVPYFSLHEFEALLFVEPHELARIFPEKPTIASTVAEWQETGLGPEDINDGPDTHPSARVKKLAPLYRKTAHGPLVTARVGLKPLRQACPHFDGWLSRLEALC